MQRLPTKNVPPRNSSSINSVHSDAKALPAVERNNEPAEAPSPLLLLARRIRQEQGADKLKDFLCAMRPFAAPNEIKRVGAGFGVSVDEAETDDRSGALRQGSAQAGAAGRGANQQVNGAQSQQMQMLQRLMLLQNALSGGGPDAASLLRMLGGMQ